MKTHKVLDLVYLEDENQDCFVGTLQECEDFISNQASQFIYKTVPLTSEEIANFQTN